MYDIQRINIWKDHPEKKTTADYLSKDIAELGLTPRSYNCLRRASCSTVGDGIKIMESEKGLISIRNLGKTSVQDITEKIEEYIAEAKKHSTETDSRLKKTIIKPGKRYWDMEIDDFGLSSYSSTRLKNCGIRYVKDLYTENAVKELFEPDACLRVVFSCIPHRERITRAYCVMANLYSNP